MRSAAFFGRGGLRFRGGSSIYLQPFVNHRDARLKVMDEQGIALSRHNIFKRDQYECQYCGSTKAGLTVDHVIPRSRGGKKGHGNAYLRGALGQAALGAARTDTFLGERYRRVGRRRGKAKAQVAVARSILTIIWHLLADPAARYTDLGPDYVASRTDRDKKIRNHVRQLQALGLQVTLTPAA